MNAKERRKAERAAKQEAYEGSKTTATTSKVDSKSSAADAVGEASSPSEVPVAPPASNGGSGGGSGGGVGGGSGGGGGGSSGGGPAAAAEAANAAAASSGSLFDGVPANAPLPKLIVFDLDATLWYVVPIAIPYAASPFAIAAADPVAAAASMSTMRPRSNCHIFKRATSRYHSPPVTLASLTLAREPELYTLRSLEGYQKCGKPGPIANTDVNLTEGGKAVLEALATDERFAASGCKLAVASRNTKGPWAEQLLKDFEIQGKSLDERIMFKEIYPVRPEMEYGGRFAAACVLS